MTGSIVEAETLQDGSGRWVVHLDRGDVALCGSRGSTMRTGEPLVVNCAACLGIHGVATTPPVVMYTGAIDLLVGLYGFGDRYETHIEKFLGSLHRCNLDNVNVFLVERECLPLSDRMRRSIKDRGLSTSVCPLGPVESCSKGGNKCREDTSRFCDWMVCNLGEAEWVWVSHFDVVFTGDFVRHVRELMPHADMVGNHHDGAVLVRRDAYREAQVGFSGADDMCFVETDYGFVRVIPTDHPRSLKSRIVLSFDVGELLALRINTLHLRHTWLRRKSDPNDIGKSDLFTHARQGSGYARDNK